VDKYLAWGYFNGACQGLDSIGGIGFILYLLETHRFQVKGNIGRGTNNQGEFKALYYLLKSDLDRGIDKL
jgi:ribonuclease HI